MEIFCTEECFSGLHTPNDGYRPTPNSGEGEENAEVIEEWDSEEDDSTDEDLFEHRNSWSTAKDLLKSMVLMVLFGSASAACVFFSTRREWLFAPNPWALLFYVVCDVCNTNWFLPQPDAYADIQNIDHEGAVVRRQFYMSFIAMVTLLMWLIFKVLKLACGSKEFHQKALNIPLVLSWVSVMEGLDWIVIICVTWWHGIHYETGLFWENWVTMYVFIWAQPIAESVFMGSVSSSTFWMAAFPFTSPRIVRFVDKIQVIVLLRCRSVEQIGDVRYTLAVAAILVMIVTIVVLAKWQLETLSAQFFLTFKTTELRHHRKEETIIDQIEVLTEPATREGKLWFALIHDATLAFITAYMFLCLGGSYFVFLAFILKVCKPVVFLIGRLIVLRRQDMWGLYYGLCARLWQWLSVVIGCCNSCCPCYAFLVGVRNRVAENWVKASEHEKVEEMLTETLERHSERLGEHHTKILEAKLLLSKSHSDVVRAEQLAREVYESRLSELGVNDPSTIDAWGNWASQRHALGQEKEAVEQMKLVLKKMQEVHPDDPETLIYMSDYANSRRKLGEVQTAKQMLQTVLNQFHDDLGPRHPYTLHSKANLAIAKSDLGQREIAEKELNDVLYDQEETLGLDHEDTLRTKVHLAGIFREHGKTWRAVEVLREVVKAHEKLNRQTTDKALRTKRELAEGLHFLGTKECKEEAEKLWKQVLECYRAKFGEDSYRGPHPKVLCARANWAKSQDPTTQVRVLMDVLRKSEKHTTLTLPDTLQVKSQLARALSKLDHESKANELVSEVLEGRTKLLGETHPKTLKSKSGYADGLRKLGRPMDAANLLQAVLTEQTETLGQDSPNTLYTKSRLALAKRDLGKRKEAGDLLKAAHKKQKEVLGENHPNTIQSMKELAVTEMMIQYLGDGTFGGSRDGKKDNWYRGGVSSNGAVLPVTHVSPPSSVPLSPESTSRDLLSISQRVSLGSARSPQLTPQLTGRMIREGSDTSAAALSASISIAPAPRSASR